LKLDRHIAAFIASIGTVLTVLVASVHAEEAAVDTHSNHGLQLMEAEADRVCFGAGVFDLLQEGYTKTGHPSAATFLEYRSGYKLLFAGPVLGAVANSDAGVYGYGGIFFDFEMGRLRFSPMLSAGGYRRGASKDLGGTFEFQESANLSYEVDGGSRFGIEVRHLSNANIHHQNPGAELLLLTVTYPLS